MSEALIKKVRELEPGGFKNESESKPLFPKRQRTYLQQITLTVAMPITPAEVNKRPPDDVAFMVSSGDEEHPFIHARVLSVRAAKLA